MFDKKEHPMKRSCRLMSVLTGLALSVCCLAETVVDGHKYVSGENVVCKDGCVQLSRVVKKVFEDDFSSQESGRWQPFTNFENLLIFKYSEKDKGLVITKNPEGKARDTAFELVSKPFDVVEGSDFVLIITASGNIEMYRSVGHKHLYHNQIVWIGKDDKPLEEPFRFKYHVYKDKVEENRIQGKVPKGAVKAVIHIGADSPNIGPQSKLCYHGVSFETEAADAALNTAGGFVSRPFLLTNGAKISWKATTNANTSVKMDVFAASDLNGTPVDWRLMKKGNVASGSALPAVSENCKWVRYRVSLTGDGKSTPKLEEVKIGGDIDKAWTGADRVVPTVERMTPALVSDASAAQMFALADQTAIDWNTLKVTLDGKDVTSSVTREESTLTFIPKEPLQPIDIPDSTGKNIIKANLHTLVLNVADVCGNCLRRDYQILVDNVEQTKNIATIRGDGAILIDGKPFFPIGVYAVCKREFNEMNFDKAFADLKAGGFNTAHTYASGRSDNFTEFLTAAEKYGFKLYIASRFGANQMSKEKYLMDVVRERHHPAVLSWYLADDTAGYCGPEELKELHDAIHEVDKAHLTSQADGVGAPDNSRYRGYVNSTDIFLPEIYPVKRDVPSEMAVPKVISDMKVIQEDLAANGNPAKSIWPIIQYFDGWSAWERFPTFDELRCMSYLCIIHGGNGITWYTYGGFKNNHGVTSTPERWKNICTVATELRDLQDVFLTECSERPFTVAITAGPAKDAMNFDSISVLYKRVGDKQYLICANSAKADVTASFTVNGATACKVWFENRDVAVAGGAFKDAFAPYAVHVYELK